jgi:hypothetical protein
MAATQYRDVKEHIVQHVTMAPDAVVWDYV